MGKKVVQRDGKWVCRRCGEYLGDTETEAKKRWKEHRRVCRGCKANDTIEFRDGKQVIVQRGELINIEPYGKKYKVRVKFRDALVEGVLQWIDMRPHGIVPRGEYSSDADEMVYPKVPESYWMFHLTRIVDGELKENKIYLFSFNNEEVEVRE